MRKSIVLIIAVLFSFALTACSGTPPSPASAPVPASSAGTPTDAASTPHPPDESTDTDSGTAIFGSNDKGQIAGMLSQYPQDLDGKAAADAGMFVTIHGIVEPGSQQIWDHFYAAVQNGDEAAVIIVQYTVEGDPILTYVSYLDGQYYYYTDITRDAFGSKEQDHYDGTYHFLKIFETDQGTYALVSNEDLASLDEYEATAENGLDTYSVLFFVNAEAMTEETPQPIRK